ncbi:hypothetical protein NPIL_398661 [Nephila pilipes]|uniref:Uncharacterized protein n=1 Tax=Nephila pilipes TaxID=299642 RepID=A0A8X6ISE4_NEPPI|nr:hypothetical protein NPIL_398661 [Nephila pilipes]
MLLPQRVLARNSYLLTGGYITSRTAAIQHLIAFVLYIAITCRTLAHISSALPIPCLVALLLATTSALPLYCCTMQRHCCFVPACSNRSLFATIPATPAIYTPRHGRHMATLWRGQA